jgi:hypothetical protein
MRRTSASGDSTRKAHPLALGLEPHSPRSVGKLGRSRLCAEASTFRRTAPASWGQNGTQKPEIQAFFAPGGGIDFSPIGGRGVAPGLGRYPPLFAANQGQWQPLAIKPSLDRSPYGERACVDWNACKLGQFGFACPLVSASCFADGTGGSPHCDDRLLLQRVQRPGRAYGALHARQAPDHGAGLWLPRLHPPMRTVRAHHTAHYGRGGPRVLRQGLFATRRLRPPPKISDCRRAAVGLVNHGRVCTMCACAPSVAHPTLPPGRSRKIEQDTQP